MADMIPFLPRLQQAIAKATPGPWRTLVAKKADNTGGIDTAIFDARDRIIAETFANVGMGNTGDYDTRPSRTNASLIVLLANAAPKIAAALEAAKGSVTALDALWEQDRDYEPTKWGRNINCARCDEGVRGFHDDTAHWADIKHKGDCIYAHGRALREALAALDGGAP